MHIIQTNPDPSPPKEWSFSADEAGDRDDQVRGGFLCACGFAAIDKGPQLTPSFEDDVAEHTAGCAFVDDEHETHRLQVVWGVSL